MTQRFIMTLITLCAGLLAACGGNGEQAILATQTAEPTALEAAFAAQTGVVQVTSLSVFSVPDGSTSVGATVVIDDTADPNVVGEALMNAATPLIMGQEIGYGFTLQQSDQETNFLGSVGRSAEGNISSSYESFTGEYFETPTPEAN